MSIETTIAGQCPIQVFQDENDLTFTVQYGAKIKPGLSWDRAAEEYGYCVFRAAQCAGLIQDDSE